MKRLRNGTGQIRGTISIAFLAAMALLAGCGLFAGNAKQEEAKPDEPKVVRYEGPMSKEFPFVYTTKKELALTFNGMGSEKMMRNLLDTLDTYQIKATFFVPGMRVAEEPDIAKMIVERGHELENNTLNRLDMTKLDYEQIHKEIQMSNTIIERETGVAPRYLRTRSGDFNDDIRLAAAQNGMDAVVSYSLFLHNWQGEDAKDKYLYLRKYITRGGIIAIDTQEDEDIIEAVSLLAKASIDVGYRFIPLHDLALHGSERKPLEQIPGYDAAKLNPDYENAKYRMFAKKETSRKEIALTFDDWGTDYTVTKILDILAEKQVKATFFLRANGAEANPNLARAIVDEGHQAANHSYSHPVVTTLTPEQLQEEVIKAHQVITYAIQQKPAMIFRPPTGEVDDKTARIIAATGYSNIALYDVTTFDWDVNNSADKIVNTIMNKIDSGSVILLHILDDIHTVEALPVAIDRLKSEGFTFVKLVDMMGLTD
ncbi:polysaccharide deacetylase family protein [Cohnella terricola]|uniref:Polysaccharide deacetylase family protein n=1 Tax=Cohnella terricola TaxID=1289167 RepID=A0A559JX99_9BACL|nr:polysaccharide deacetylase family protein [Cohnella terricola]TVY04509.1 polysaccharide deacetylase family protein [Cohnella terricola]